MDRGKLPVVYVVNIVKKVATIHSGQMGLNNYECILTLLC